MVEKKKKAPARKPVVAKKAAVKKVSYKSGYECKLCGYRLVVDRECGCGEEHAILCCGKPMKKVKIAV
ncbi:MAG TPA: hypothetical protein PKH53_07845 [Candidatus Saccharicenans sp.]|nr:hypothetical protein [Candidatus Saccharicenans sp.]